MWCSQTPIRHGTHCWVFHPGFGNQIIGEARAGVNNKSRSNHPDMVAMLKDGEQWILFKVIHRHDVPLMFPDDPHLGPHKMCDSVLKMTGRAETWVRWSSKFLRAQVDEDTVDGQ